MNCFDCVVYVMAITFLLARRITENGREHTVATNRVDVLRMDDLTPDYVTQKRREVRDIIDRLRKGQKLEAAWLT